MAIVHQSGLFSWDQVDEASDLDRLRVLLRALPDEELMQALEDERKGRRDDYPVCAMWNSLLAAIVFQHEGPESLRRELARNGQLLQLCGFDVFRGERAVPPAWVYTRFLRKLMRHWAQVERMMDALIDRLEILLPDLGTRLVVDSKGFLLHERQEPAAQRGRDGWLRRKRAQTHSLALRI